MTRPEIEAIEQSGQYLPQDIAALCALAKEALELREALEWLGKKGHALIKIDAGWCVVHPVFNLLMGKGSTPLEAIQAARRGM